MCADVSSFNAKGPDATVESDCQDARSAARRRGTMAWRAEPDKALPWVNDLHSNLNPTRVRRIAMPDSSAAVQSLVRQAKAEGEAISIAGGRHAMGGQQFGTDTLLLDTGKLNRVLNFDPKAGQIEVEAGIQWPALLAFLHSQQADVPGWGIRQKQTGADRLSIGGALSANVHGRGLAFKPIIADVESFTLIDAEGRLIRCSRRENRNLFRLAIGGYGLFGVIATVRLRLVPRRKVQRVVQLIDLEDLVPAIERRIADGYLYGDFQFAIDGGADNFLRQGILSCYQPIADDATIPDGQSELHPDDWMRLFHLAHTDKSHAFELYSRYYLSTHGQRYWSDSHQLSEYVNDYHRQLDLQLGPDGFGSEMITELFVPRQALSQFMARVRQDLRANNGNVIYGTVRFIEKDDESFLPWARGRYACVIFNLHAAHNHADLARSARTFRQLISRAIEHGGSYYLTYHRWASRAQVEACYPRFVEFLKLKRHYDPDERFQSDWYRHYCRLFADLLSRTTTWRPAAPRT